MQADHATWPALDLAGRPLRAELTCSRGVWGKAHGAATDYRWIAASPSFRFVHDGLERELNVGSEDEPRHAFFWRVVGEYAFAAVTYPSRARDAAGRGDFSEKQVLAWNRPADLPSALGALLLLPRTREWSDDVWWEERSRPGFSDPDFVLEIAGDEPVPVTPEDVETAVERGIRELCGWLSEESLRELFAALLAGGRAVPTPRRESGPLPPEALAAVLLPFPRPLCDRLSLAGWLPSRRFDLDQLAGRWDLVAGARWSEAQGPAPTSNQREQAARIVEALNQRNPAVLKKKAVVGAASLPAPAVDDDSIQIALWGPQAAGKTVLIAQLYLYIGEPKLGIDWEILPDETSLEFIKQMRLQMYRNNQFPKATLPGAANEIIYNFFNRTTGRRASMVVEDRAGVDYERLHPEAQERLRAAKGLVLLFDPTRVPAQLELEVAQTLEQVHVSRGKGRKDERPIAVCVSKADVLVRTTADYDWAVHDGESFVRDKVDDVLVRTLERFCTNYRLFPVSSAGLKLVHGVVEPTVFYDETLTPRLGRGGEPLNLMTPFAWVLDEVDRS